MQAATSLAMVALAGQIQFAEWAGMMQPVPAPCEAIPAPDTLNGSTGSAPCFTPRDAARPTVIQAATAITNGSGIWAVAWARPFGSDAPVVAPLAINSGALPIVCNVASRSASAATGKCWQATSTTLAGALAGLLGMVVSPFATPAANASVMVTAREPTQ